MNVQVEDIIIRQKLCLQVKKESLFTQQKLKVKSNPFTSRSPLEVPQERKSHLAGGSVCFYFSVPRGVKLSWVLLVASAI